MGYIIQGGDTRRWDEKPIGIRTNTCVNAQRDQNLNETRLSWGGLRLNINVTGDDHWPTCCRIPPQTILYARMPENRVCQFVISSSVIFRNVTSGTLKLCPAGRAASDVLISLGQL